MYQKEILNQSKTIEEEKKKIKIFEDNLRQEIKDKQQEIGKNLKAPFLVFFLGCENPPSANFFSILAFLDCGNKKTCLEKIGLLHTILLVVSRTSEPKSELLKARVHITHKYYPD